MSKQYFQVAFFCMSVNLTLLCYNEKLICPICTSKFKRFLRNFYIFFITAFSSPVEYIDVASSKIVYIYYRELLCINSSVSFFFLTVQIPVNII